jgi:hypothetical protein
VHPNAASSALGAVFVQTYYLANHANYGSDGGGPDGELTHDTYLSVPCFFKGDAPGFKDEVYSTELLELLPLIGATSLYRLSEICKYNRSELALSKSRVPTTSLFKYGGIVVKDKQT